MMSNQPLSLTSSIATPTSSSEDSISPTLKEQNKADHKEVLNGSQVQGEGASAADSRERLDE